MFIVIDCCCSDVGRASLPPGGDCVVSGVSTGHGMFRHVQTNVQTRPDIPRRFIGFIHIYRLEGDSIGCVSVCARARVCVRVALLTINNCTSK